MKIIEQQAEMIHWTKDPLKIIATAARTCYQTEGKRSNEDLVGMLIKKGHLSPLEFADLHVLFTTDRGISHELVRHRLCAFAQESTRYCKYNNEISVIEPPGLEGDSKYAWQTTVYQAEESYLSLLKNGIKPEIARSVLPTCLKTQINCKANFREWRYILQMRYLGISGTPHPQIKALMKPVYDFFKSCFPVIVEDLS